MPQLVFIPLIVVVLLGLAWSWWVGRVERDPASSVDSFHRALSAMQPGGPDASDPAPATEEATEDEVAAAGSVPRVRT